MHYLGATFMPSHFHLLSPPNDSTTLDFLTAVSCMPLPPYENSDSSCLPSAGLICELPTLLLLTHTHMHAHGSTMAESHPYWSCSVPSHLVHSQSRSQNRPRRKSSLLLLYPLGHLKICIPPPQFPKSALPPHPSPLHVAHLRAAWTFLFHYCKDAFTGNKVA